MPVATDIFESSRNYRLPSIYNEEVAAALTRLSPTGATVLTLSPFFSAPSGSWPSLPAFQFSICQPAHLSLFTLRHTALVLSAHFGITTESRACPAVQRSRCSELGRTIGVHSCSE